MKKNLILLFIILATISSFGITNTQEKEINMRRLFKKEDPIEKFWNWFKENESRLRKFEENPDRYLDEVLIQAKNIKAGLAIEFEPPKKGIINMTISADGDRNIFNVVQAIIDKAPKIDGWNFIAFRQRMNLEKVKNMTLKAQGYELDPSKMKFFPIIDGDTLDIIIYTKSVTEDNINDIAYAGLLLIDNILGEYDCVIKVRSYDFHDMPVDKKELKELLPLLELASFVDYFHSSKKN